MFYVTVENSYKSISGKRHSLIAGERYFAVRMVEGNYFSMRTANARSGDKNYKNVLLPEPVFNSLQNRGFIKIDDVI